MSEPPDVLDARRREEFTHAYTRALVAAWSSDEYAAYLESDPAPALREVGVALPDGARVRVVRTDAPSGAAPDEEAALAEQADRYAAGLAGGEFVFHVPRTPQLDTGELTEGELDGVAAGWAGGERYCCCCCPSCCVA